MLCSCFHVPMYFRIPSTILRFNLTMQNIGIMPFSAFPYYSLSVFQDTAKPCTQVFIPYFIYGPQNS